MKYLTEVYGEYCADPWWENPKAERGRAYMPGSIRCVRHMHALSVHTNRVNNMPEYGPNLSSLSCFMQYKTSNYLLNHTSK